MNQKIIYLENIKKNIEYFMSFKKDLTIMVKADAYGHSVEKIVPLLSKFNVKLGVATLDEAIKLNEVWKGEILVVEPLKKFNNLPENVEFCIEDYCSFVEVQRLSLQNRCYIKINSGMNRFGIKCDEIKTLKKIAKVSKKKGIKGLMTHFSYLEDKETTFCQYEKFLKVRKFFASDIDISFGGSNTCLYNFDHTELRVGIGFYGYENNNVQPIVKVKSQVLRILDVKSGDKVGYSSGYVATGKQRIAVIGIGYGDGFRRDLKGFYVLINGHKCRIVGNVCMDCCFADATNVICSEGDEVLLERADVTAEYLKTISYEVLTGYSNLRADYQIYE